MKNTFHLSREVFTKESFKYCDVLLDLGLLTDKDNSKVKLFRDKLKVKLEKSELISLTLRAESAEDAKLELNAVINQLISIHEKILATTVNRWHQDLALLELQLKQNKTT